eukprot:jgi/Galph1/5882/GphlegSOOS_G4495.1
MTHYSECLSAERDIDTPTCQNIWSSLQVDLVRHFRNHQHETSQLDRFWTTADKLKNTRLPQSFIDSSGLWCENNKLWEQRQQKWRRQAERQSLNPHNDPGIFFSYNWEPDFGCALEERLGNTGDGGKWVCDSAAVKQRTQYLMEAIGNPYRCLIYSFSSNNDFSFETSILQWLPHCQIHVFDPTSSPSLLFSTHISLPSESQLVFHSRALSEASSNDSLAQIATNLNHKNPADSLEILKLDIEGAEFEALLPSFRVMQKLLSGLVSWSELNDVDKRAFQTWLLLRRAGQVLVEVHSTQNSTEDTNELLRGLYQSKFAIFHKEPNIGYCSRNCVEYAFLRLQESFFNYRWRTRHFIRL